MLGLLLWWVGVGGKERGEEEDERRKENRDADGRDCVEM